MSKEDGSQSPPTSAEESSGDEITPNVPFSESFAPPPPGLIDEDELPVVQTILGQDEDNSELFYVKFTDKSYIHCRWMTEEDLLISHGGEMALSRYRKKRQRVDLTNSLSVPRLLSFGENAVDPLWFQVDRVIDKNAGPSGLAYLVKWKGMEYRDVSWELERDIPKDAIDAYEKRMKTSNMKKIPSRWVRPTLEYFRPWPTSIVSVDGDTLRDYQIIGMNWLRYNWFCRRNTILADEMGLGKTVQIVATLVSLAVEFGVRGPFLVVAPMSTLPHWQSEFERWSELNAVIYHGCEQSRCIIMDKELDVWENGKIVENRVRADVVITTYETLSNSAAYFEKVQWRYLVADEGHKLKNYKGKRYLAMQRLTFEHCTILTGTPIQNNMVELWSLLHFVNPVQFPDIDMFLAKYGEVTDVSKTQQIQELILPLLLRRRKCDVEKSLAPKEETIIQVEITHIQKMLYRALINEKSSTLLRQITSGSLPALQNLSMQLRKLCNHPFLIKGAEESIKAEIQKKEKDLTEAELHEKSLIDSSGKMILVNKLLPKLKTDGHKVLLFSQMVKVLDIVEDFLRTKGYMYERIDGTRCENDRRASIDRFNEDPEDFVFLLSTKAGGMGINLTSADTVIIYDSDWNPQNDLQAQARCHRIGQKGTVKVYRLITRGTYEEEMFDRASKKLGLDHAILDGGNTSAAGPMSAEEIEEILRKGVYGAFDDDNTEIEKFCEADIDQILENRSIVRKQDVVSGGESKFSKATFETAENETNKDFWAKILPKMKGEESEDMLRRCRSKSQEDIGDFGRKTIKNLIDRGYRGGSEERKILRIAYSMRQPTDLGSLSAIHKLVLEINREDGEELCESNGDIDALIAKHGEIVLTITEKLEKILLFVAFFRRIDLVMHYLQGSEIVWPVIEPVWGTPYLEYAIMYGFKKYGWRNYGQIFEDKDLPFKQAKLKLPREQAYLRLKQLLSEFETQYNDDNDLPSDFAPDPPDVWEQKHPELEKRVVVFNNDVYRIFSTVKAIGVPTITPDSHETDWGRFISFSNLTDIDEALIHEVTSQILSLCEILPNEFTPIPWDSFESLETLKGRVKAKDFMQLKKTIPWNAKIHNFCATYTPSMMEIIKQTPKNPRFPDWWSAEHDRCLIFALDQYGILKLTSILVDPSFCFHNHIPVEEREKFEEAAAEEAISGTMVRPKNPSSFSFLFRKNTRVRRAVNVIEFVEKKLSGAPVKGKRSKDRSKVDTSKYEYIATKKLRIRTFGVLRESSYRAKIPPVPIGFISERQLTPDEGGGCFMCEVTEKDNRPWFTVTLLGEDGEKPEDPLSYSSKSPTDAWRGALELIYQGAVQVRRPGMPSFGFTNKYVRSRLEEMEAAYVKEHGSLPVIDSEDDTLMDECDLEPPEEGEAFKIEIPVFKLKDI